MIIPNGYIKIKTTTGGGFENGKPVKATTLSSDFIEANINESNRWHGQIGEETKGTKATYTILIDPYTNEDIWTDIDELMDTCYGLGVWKSSLPWKGLVKWVSGEGNNGISPLSKTQSLTLQATGGVMIEPPDTFRQAEDIAASDRDKVEVFDARRISLGTFEIQSARFLEFVQAIKIQV